jgi:hypothetical protein
VVNRFRVLRNSATLSPECWSGGQSKGAVAGTRRLVVVHSSLCRTMPLPVSASASEPFSGMIPTLLFRGLLITQTSSFPTGTARAYIC